MSGYEKRYHAPLGLPYPPEGPGHNREVTTDSRPRLLPLGSMYGRGPPRRQPPEPGPRFTHTAMPRTADRVPRGRRADAPRAVPRPHNGSSARAVSLPAYTVATVRLYNVLNARAKAKPLMLLRNLRYSASNGKRDHGGRGSTSSTGQGLAFYVQMGETRVGKTPFMPPAVTVVMALCQALPDKQGYVVCAARMLSAQPSDQQPEALFTIPEPFASNGVRKELICFTWESNVDLTALHRDCNRPLSTGLRASRCGSKLLFGMFPNKLRCRWAKAIIDPTNDSCIICLDFGRGYIGCHPSSLKTCARKHMCIELSSARCAAPWPMHQLSSLSVTLQVRPHPGGSGLRRGATDGDTAASRACSTSGTDLSWMYSKKTDPTLFHYMSQDNRHVQPHSEVTEHWSCPLCTMRCSDFVGLRLHMGASHDLFKYKFEKNGLRGIPEIWVDCWHYRITSTHFSSSLSFPISGAHLFQDTASKEFYFFSRGAQVLLSDHTTASGKRALSQSTGSGVHMSRVGCKQEVVDLISDDPPESSVPRMGGAKRRRSVSEDTCNPNAARRREFVERDTGVIEILDTDEEDSDVVPFDSMDGNKGAAATGVPTLKRVMSGGSVTGVRACPVPTARIAHAAKEVGLHEKDESSSAVEENSCDGLPVQGLVLRKSDQTEKSNIGTRVAALDVASESEDEAETPFLAKRPRAPLTAKAKKAHRQALAKRTYFHSKTCQMMPLAEVLGGHDSDDECPEEELLQSHRHSLGNLPANPTSKEQKFMLMWNMYASKNPVFSDAITPACCQRFARVHKAELIGDAELRGHFVMHLMNLLKFGLLSPSNIQRCLRGLTPIATEAAKAPRRTSDDGDSRS